MHQIMCIENPTDGKVIANILQKPTTTFIFPEITQDATEKGFLTMLNPTHDRFLNSRRG